MKLKPKKLFAYAGLALLGSVILLVVAVYARQGRTFDAPYPNIAASRDPADIARGFT